MSLISCVECGRSVSNRADVCPHCGRRYPGITDYDGGCLGWITLICVIILTFFLFLSWYR